MSIIAQIGFKAIELINEQVERGIDKDGKPYKYSTKPFALPAGNKKFAKKIFGEKSEGAKLKAFQKGSGKLWYLVHGGYKSWRELHGRDGDGDFLQWTGQMLRSMSAREENGNAVVYFADAESARKAMWFNFSGIGKTRKLWKFFGLTDESIKKLIEFARDRFIEIGDIDEMLKP